MTLEITPASWQFFSLLTGILATKASRCMIRNLGWDLIYKNNNLITNSDHNFRIVGGHSLTFRPCHFMLRKEIVQFENTLKAVVSMPIKRQNQAVWKQNQLNSIAAISYLVVVI